MQRILLFAATMVVLATSCDNDLDLTAPWKDIPVVYGIVSPADTAHYIRIEKAYLDPAISALKIARIPDSLYYENAEAALVSIATGERSMLQRIDATLDGYPRENGVFAEDPNILYKIRAIDANLVPGQKYRLEVKRTENKPLVTAEATIVARPVLTIPQAGARLRFNPTGFYRVAWLASSGAAFYDVILYIHYTEYHIADPGNGTQKTEVWKDSGVVTSTGIQVPGIEFYEFLRGEIAQDAALRRILTNIDVQVRAGGVEMYEFQRVQLANSGITSAGGDIPQYSNVSEGVGVFSSSNRVTQVGLTLHDDSRDSLIMGSITKSLNFQ
jgi:hypothetical protein